MPAVTYNILPVQTSLANPCHPGFQPHFCLIHCSPQTAVTRLSVAEMLSKSASLLSWLALLGIATVGDAKPCAVTNVDVAVIGGGASGTYAAIRLVQDYGLKVALVEKNDRLVRGFPSVT
jgi:hypothetical protein